MIPRSHQSVLLALLPALLALSPAAAQPLRLGDVARRHPDAVVLVADARTGRVLGGVRMAEANTVAHYPASLFKIALAVALLDEGSRPNAVHACAGADTIDGQVHRCWLSAGHGALTLDGAIARSCNLWFRRAAERLSRSTITARARALGLLPPQHTGAITDSLLLGEAARTTPAMLLRTALALASRGRLARPTLSLNGSRYRPLYAGLRECVRSGTARAAWSRRVAIGGKTGTAAIDGRPGARAGWFIGFAPFDRPQFAIVVLEKNGMGSDAALIAREILEKLL